MTAAGERWSIPEEIRDYLVPWEKAKTSGPILYDGMVDVSQEHIVVLGSTNRGKTTCLSLPFSKMITERCESGVVIDVKGDFTRHYWPQIKEKYNQAYLVDFSSPSQSAMGFNPLWLIYLYFFSEDTREKDFAQDLLHDLFSENLFSDQEKTNDVFWPHSAAALAQGLCEALFEAGKPETIHIASIMDMLCKMEEKSLSTRFMPAGKRFRDLLRSSAARQNLSSYLDAPNETRASIFSVATNGLSAVNRTSGMQELLSRNELDFSKLDLTQPFFIILRIPDYSTGSHIAAGMLISQLSKYLIYKADTCFEGMLPIRCSFILEELSSIGKAITNLPQLCAQGRSRNLRLMLILQDQSQLNSVFGEENSRTIMSCMGIHVLFSTMNYQTLEEYSLLLGDKVSVINDHSVPVRLNTPAQLGDLRTGEALVIIKGKVSLKYTHHFQTYEELFGKALFLRNDSHEKRRISLPPEIFDLIEFIDRHQSEADENTSLPKTSDKEFVYPFAAKEDEEQEDNEDDEEDDDEDRKIDELILTIEKEFEKLEKTVPIRRYWLRITSENYKISSVMRVLKQCTSLQWMDVEKNQCSNNIERKFYFSSLRAAKECVEKLKEIGVEAVVGYDGGDE